ncbi:MAG TPA: hypothetical protein VI138_07890 [Candidatus Dormibacteraeota bacterium]
MSDEVLGAASELTLDDRHTLVAVEPEALERIWQSGGGEGLGWLLFRAGSAATSPPDVSERDRPELWFELSGQRFRAELAEAVGWGDLGAAAVALFELASTPAPTGAGDGSGQATCGIRSGGQELSAELPRAWLDRWLELPARS